MAIKKSELKEWAKENMVGVENCLFPSFSPDLSELDEEGIRWDVQQSIEHGFFSTLCAAETGLTFEEAKRFVEIVADEAGGKILVSVTLLFDSFEQNREMLRHAEEVGCHAILFGYPANWYPKSGEEIYQITKEMCDSTNLAIVLYPTPHYNFQRLHNSGFPLDALTRMADIENVVAIKVGEPGLIAACERRFGDKILVSCPVERWLPLMVLGFGQQWIGAGCYEVFQSPEKPYLVDYFRLLREGKLDEAMEIYWMLTPARVIFEQQFMPTAMLGTYNWTQQKYYQWCVGGNGGLTRQPSMKIHQHEMEATKVGFRMIGIDPGEPDEEFYVGRLNYAKLRKEKSREEEAREDVSAVTFSDLDDNKVSLSSFRGQVLVLYGGGRGATEETKKWGEALVTEYEGREGVKAVEMALGGPLPRFVPKGAVKKKIREEATTPPLIDWDGEPAKALGVEDANIPHVMVIDKEGLLRLKLVGDYSEEGFSRVGDQVEKLT